jgi:hypothetical protein
MHFSKKRTFCEAVILSSTQFSRVNGGLMNQFRLSSQPIASLNIPCLTLKKKNDYTETNIRQLGDPQKGNHCHERVPLKTISLMRLFLAILKRKLILAAAKRNSPQNQM